MPRQGPLPLKGVRVTDLTWLLASAGTSTLLTSLGAEVIRIEWPERLDFTRLGETAGVGVAARESNPRTLGMGKKSVPFPKIPKGPPPAASVNR